MDYMKEEKKWEAINSKRETRKSEFYNMGKNRFGFDSKDEVIKYKYITGDKLTQEEWDKTLRTNIPVSFKQWKEEVDTKYSHYLVEHLVEFKAYLRVGIKNKEIYKVEQTFVYTAIFSSLITGCFSQILNSTFTENSAIVSFFLTVIISIIGILGVGRMIVSNMKHVNYELETYQIYCNMIDGIIDERNNTESEL